MLSNMLIDTGTSSIFSLHSSMPNLLTQDEESLMDFLLTHAEEVTANSIPNHMTQEQDTTTTVHLLVTHAEELTSSVPLPLTHDKKISSPIKFIQSFPEETMWGLPNTLTRAGKTVRM